MVKLSDRSGDRPFRVSARAPKINIVPQSKSKRQMRNITFAQALKASYTCNYSYGISKKYQLTHTILLGYELCGISIEIN